MTIEKYTNGELKFPMALMGFMNVIIITAGIIGLIYTRPLEEGITWTRCSIFESTNDILNNSTWIGKILFKYSIFKRNDTIG